MTSRSLAKVGPVTLARDPNELKSVAPDLATFTGSHDWAGLHTITEQRVHLPTPLFVKVPEGPFFEVELRRDATEDKPCGEGVPEPNEFIYAA